MITPRRHRPVLVRLMLCAMLLTVLGGSFKCSWSSNHDDDDDGRDDDDDSNQVVTSDTGGATGFGVDLAERLALMNPVFIEPLPPVMPGLPAYDAQDYRAQGFQVTPGGAPGEAAVLRVDVWDGPSVNGAFGPGSYGPAELAEFADRVRRAHDDLLALPPEAGALQLQGTAFVDGLILVRWVQTRSASDAPQTADPEHRMTIVLDGMGRLLHIENAVDIPAG